MEYIVPIAIAVIGLAVVVVALFLIPALIQLRRTAVSAQGLIDKMNREVDPLIARLKETGENLNKVSLQAREGLESVRGFLEAVGDLAGTLKVTNSILRGSALRLLINTAGLIAGIKSGASTFMGRLSKGR